MGQSLHELRPVGGHLEVDVSAVATDVNGNHVPDSTKVNFSVVSVEFDEDRDYDNDLECWASNKDPINYDDYYAVGDTDPDELGEKWFTDDVNLNGSLDFSATEDANGNGVIDPVGSAVIEGSVETVNGVATAVMTYPQPHAANIKVRVSAELGGISNFYETILLCTEVMVESGVCGIDY